MIFLSPVTFMMLMDGAQYEDGLYNYDEQIGTAMWWVLPCCRGWLSL